ncbi:13222_t:CDS:1, partial [Racocetra persica]
WSSDTAPPKPEPPTPTWDPNEVNNMTIQEAKAPIYFKKKHTPAVNFDLDDCEGWGAPPTKCIPWNDSRQGYCIELIEEQKETTFWSLQNGSWVNVSEENQITEQISEYSPDGSKFTDVRQLTRTRFGRQGIQSRSFDVSPLDEQVRNENEERSLTMSNPGEIGNVVIELTDSSDNETLKDKKIHLNYETPTIKESHERLGNPQWIPKH